MAVSYPGTVKTTKIVFPKPRSEIFSGDFTELDKASYTSSRRIFSTSLYNRNVIIIKLFMCKPGDKIML